MVIINGEEISADGMSVSEYLIKEELSPERVAVMLDGEILPKTEYDSTLLRDGNELDVIGFVGGG